MWYVFNPYNSYTIFILSDVCVYIYIYIFGMYTHVCSYTYSMVSYLWKLKKQTYRASDGTLSVIFSAPESQWIPVVTCDASRIFRGVTTCSYSSITPSPRIYSEQKQPWNSWFSTGEWIKYTTFEKQYPLLLKIIYSRTLIQTIYPPLNQHRDCHQLGVWKIRFHNPGYFQGRSAMVGENSDVEMPMFS